MKYVTGKDDKIRVIELPDDARAITSEEEAAIAAKEQKQTQEYADAVKRAETRAEILGQINALKGNLRKTDYQAIKYAEGELSAYEYAETKSQRAAWRAEINRLEVKSQKI